MCKYSQVAIRKDVNGATFSTSSVVALDLQQILVMVTVGSPTCSGSSSVDYRDSESLWDYIYPRLVEYHTVKPPNNGHIRNEAFLFSQFWISECALGKIFLMLCPL